MYSWVKCRYVGSPVEMNRIQSLMFKAFIVRQLLCQHGIPVPLWGSRRHGMTLLLSSYLQSLLSLHQSSREIYSRISYFSHHCDETPARNGWKKVYFIFGFSEISVHGLWPHWFSDHDEAKHHTGKGSLHGVLETEGMRREAVGKSYLTPSKCFNLSPSSA